MPKNLLIVESPAKASTIKKYLGADFNVASSFGHIRDLPKTGLAVAVEKNFEPTYEVPKEKKDVLSKLKTALKGTETVWLATDEDREGEAIAWHLSAVLGLDPTEVNRIVFHEITEPAIKEAIKHPRKLNMPTVDAQQARRVLDRLVGYELSPVLWKKVRRGLSAGRVQSVAVRLIVEREREIEGFSPEDSFKTTITLETAGKETVIASTKRALKNADEARAFLQQLLGSTLAVTDLIEKPVTKTPPPPFTTSTLQQAASTQLNFSVKQTMLLAQRLYEAGHITYMRTDSVNLSEVAREQMLSTIKSRYGEQYLGSRHYKSRASAQEAHEAIRPTDFALTEPDVDQRQKRLYQLIYTRALGSQMAAAKLLRTTVTITGSSLDQELQANGEVIQFDGFLKLQPVKNNKEILPALKVGEELSFLEAESQQVFSNPPKRYSEAMLVKKLEELGIGRPSTYAPIISTIQDRGYVEKGDIEGVEMDSLVLAVKAGGAITESGQKKRVGADKNRLLPTDTGLIVTDFLAKHFEDIMDYGFTAKIEAKFDEVAGGTLDWRAMLKDFYGPFHKLVDSSEAITKHEATQARDLGVDPKTKRPVYARLGRYGPMVQLGDAEDKDKPKFAPLPKDLRIDSVSLEQALELLKLPRTVGTTKDGEGITTNFGRFGPYIKVGSTYVAITPESPLTITEAKARELYEARAELEKKRHIKSFEQKGIDVRLGRYGPYVTDGKKNAKIPSSIEPADIDLKTAEELLAKKKPGRRRKG